MSNLHIEEKLYIAFCVTMAILLFAILVIVTHGWALIIVPIFGAVYYLLFGSKS